MPRRFARFAACFVLIAVPVVVRAVDDKAPLADEWQAVFLGTDKVGYVHSVANKIRENGKDMIEVRAESVMSIRRDKQTTELKTEFSSVETPDGKLIRLDNRTKQSAEEVRTIGEVIGKALKLTMQTPGKQNSGVIPWDDDILAPFAEDQLLKKRPLKPGEKLKYRSFSPDFNQVLTNTLTGEAMEEVTLLDGSKRKLQRILAQIDGVPMLKNMKVYQWIDENAETLKEHTDFVFSTTLYRTTKEVAMAKPTTVSGDFLQMTLITPQKKIPNPYNASEIVYRIEVTDDDPASVIPQDDRQSLSKGPDGETLLTIRAIDPTKPAANSKKPAPEYLQSNNYLQTDNAKVIQAAKDAVGDATDPWEKAQRIEKWVHTNVKDKNFSLGLASAAEVAKNLEGDCTEHGVLLAAMARAVGVPARVAVGLVYAERLGAFGYHMWSEVYINGHWVPVDGTLGRGHASPAHIKIFDSSMAGVDALATFLPVAGVMNRLKIEVVSWKHAEGN